MEAVITSDGKLVITAENSTEAYALSRWFDNYGKGDNTSVLQCGGEKRPVVYDYSNIKLSDFKP